MYCLSPEGTGPFIYTNRVEGDITSFRGHEEIGDISVGRWGLKVFEQDYIGGLILPKPKQ